jgi:hypothetical protein
MMGVLTYSIPQSNTLLLLIYRSISHPSHMEPVGKVDVEDMANNVIGTADVLADPGGDTVALVAVVAGAAGDAVSGDMEAPAIQVSTYRIATTQMKFSIGPDGRIQVMQLQEQCNARCYASSVSSHMLAVDVA